MSFPDAYDRFLSNELANERETDNIRNHVWEEHTRTHADGATDVNATIANLCDTVEDLRRENEELREGIRRERKDSEISFETAEIYMTERDEALAGVARLRERVQVLELQREELRHHMQAGLGKLVSGAVGRMFDRIQAGDIPEALTDDVPELKRAA